MIDVVDDAREQRRERLQLRQQLLQRRPHTVGTSVDYWSVTAKYGEVHHPACSNANPNQNTNPNLNPNPNPNPTADPN